MKREKRSKCISEVNFDDVGVVCSGDTAVMFRYHPQRILNGMAIKQQEEHKRPDSFMGE